MEQLVPTYKFLDGTQQVSSNVSAFFWRYKLGSTAYMDYRPSLSGNCEVCHNGRRVYDPDFGEFDCICQVKQLELSWVKRTRPYQSATQARSLAELIPWVEKTEADNNIIRMLDAAREFEAFPEKWLTLTGAPGTGKTHVLQWLAQQLGPLALYITDTEFEGLVFQETQSGTLSDLIDTIKTIPVLLYDDVGSSYGSRFGLAALRRIIDFRYNRPDSFPVAATTNLPDDQLRALDLRIADRLKDREVAVEITLRGVPSWRTRSKS